MQTRETKRNAVGGWVAVAAVFLTVLSLGYGWYSTVRPALAGSRLNLYAVVGLGLTSLVWFMCPFGFFTLQPNVSAVLILFGKYSGTVLASGFHWANPLLIKKKLSLRAHNLNGEKLKVNDQRGNPIGGFLMLPGNAESRHLLVLVACNTQTMSSDLRADRSLTV